MAEGVGEDELLRLTAAAEARSSHPLARTILDELEQRGLPNDLTVGNFENIAGSGIRASVDGREVLVGAQRLLDGNNVGLGPIQSTVDRLLGEGKTLVLVAIDGRASGVIAAADTVRASAAHAISELVAMGVEPVMMTGDGRRTAEAVAKEDQEIRVLTAGWYRAGLRRGHAGGRGKRCPPTPGGRSGKIHRHGRRRRQRCTRPSAG